MLSKFLRSLRHKLRKLIHPIRLKKTHELAARYEVFAKTLTIQDKYEIDTLIRPYAHKFAPRDTLFERLENDLKYFSPLINNKASINGFSLYLTAAPRVLGEGLFSLMLEYENKQLYFISFTFYEEFLLISCAQGLADIATLKAATKAASGLRPINLALNFAQDLANRSNKILAGVKSFAQMSAYRKRKNDFIDYDELWQANAQILKEHEYFYAIKIIRKDLEQIPSKKRSEYKRRFALIDDLIKDFYETR